MRIKNVSGVIFPIGIATVGFFCFLAAKSVATARWADEDIHVVPFTLKMNVYNNAELYQVKVIGRRADGAHIEQRSLGPLANGEWGRSLRFPNGTSMQLIDGLQIKVISKVTDPRFVAGMKEKLSKESVTCAFNRGVVVGTDTILGQFVEQISSIAGKGEFKLDTSNAPSLGCEILAYESFRRESDGSYKLATKGVPMSLDLVEPDPNVFDVGSSYREVSWDESERLIGAHLHSLSKQ
jgi:hypothetical protein